IAAADASREAEKRPHDEAAAAVQEKYAPLIGDTKKLRGKAVLAREALTRLLTVWRTKQLTEQQAAAIEARALAQETARHAAEAVRQARVDLAASSAAQDLMRSAEDALRLAKRIEADKPKGLRTVWVTSMADPVAAARWAWTRHRDACEAFFLDLARRDVREGKRTIEGFVVTETKVAI
ncbi:MAG: hypothetical protein ACHP84_10590, partial [Caulobacterales bacterium]